ncbi:hypothetical protein [Flavobacterium sp. 25HG05S-40]|uniref:hypothetical protein n=1 Tax=Flavobacterium sp. 25HG05S-40 TaxID=3458682 RepID=UPI004044F2C0
MKKSWKTTSTGVLLIIGGVVRFYFAVKAGNFTEEAITTCATSILGGIGLLFAKDQDVTGAQ